MDRKSTSSTDTAGHSGSASAGRRERNLLRTQDEELDRELDDTFPASDPVPWHHGS